MRSEVQGARSHGSEAELHHCTQLSDRLKSYQPSHAYSVPQQGQSTGSAVQMCIERDGEFQTDGQRQSAKKTHRTTQSIRAA